jgi:uroporphyrinogen-III synthase
MELLFDKTAMNGVKVAVIGPITAATAKKHGLEPAVVPVEYTIPSLVKAIVKHFKKLPCQ